MFDVAPTELMLVALVALVVIGPKDLPRLMRTVGQWAARARGMARHFRSGMDEMIRQAEIEEMERKWAEDNARIMREHPPLPDDGAPEAQAPMPAPDPEWASGAADLPTPSGAASPEADVAEPPAPPAPQAELPLGNPPTAGRAA